MPLHPQCKDFLDQIASQPGQPFEEMSLEEIQAFRDAMPNGFEMAGPPEPVARVEDRVIPTPTGLIPVRLYWPNVDTHLPVLVFFHGGGWVFGNPAWIDSPCRSLANASGALVVSVDYRLAPEHRYPTAAEDCYAVTKHIADHPEDFAADPTRIAVGGDSAGGNLAAVVCQMARDRGGPHISYQVLIYPCIDPQDQSPSMRENAEGYFLTKSGMKWFWDQYAGSNHAPEPYLSPIHAKSLAGLPPALVITAEYDPLRDQGELYGKRLAEAGVPTTVKRFDGMIHGFCVMGGFIEAGREVLALCGAGVASALSFASAQAQ